MQVIEIGKVSNREDAREHWSVYGWAFCGAGAGRTMAATRWRVDGTVLVAGVCRRCLKALRRRLAEAGDAGDEYAASAAYMLEPQDAARDRLMVADMRRHLRAVHTPDPTPAELAGLDSDTFRRRLLAELGAA